MTAAYVRDGWIYWVSLIKSGRDTEEWGLLAQHMTAESIYSGIHMLIANIESDSSSREAAETLIAKEAAVKGLFPVGDNILTRARNRNLVPVTEPCPPVFWL